MASNYANYDEFAGEEPYYQSQVNIFYVVCLTDVECVDSMLILGWRTGQLS